jgi:hypothetical protein
VTPYFDFVLKLVRYGMEINGNYLAPCGLYCGVCAVMYAARDENLKFKERLVPVYKGKLHESEEFSAKDIHCDGCLSASPFVFCRVCPLKSCTREKGYAGCHECNQFPCKFVEEFPIPIGKKVMLRTIPRWREVGTEQFVREEEARYICPGCDHKLFRGAKRCNRCKLEVDLD